MKASLVILTLSAFVIESILAVTTSISNCPPGLAPVYCFVDPCTVSKCPEDSNAKCLSIYGGGCNAVWLSANGGLANYHKKCKRPGDQREVMCIQDPCQGETCSAYPDAKYVLNYCGGCNFGWFNSNGEKVECKISS